MAYQVTVTYPNGQVLTFPFEKHEIYCGRAPGNDIRLAHGFVSSRHFRIRQQDGRFFVEDVGSTNGSVLNGQAMEAHIPQSFTPDDRLQVGTLEIRLAPIVEATIIERISRPLPSGDEALRLAGRPAAAAVAPPPTDEAAPLWQIQTGMMRQQAGGTQTGAIRIDDQSVSVPRGEPITSFQQPGFEERIRRTAPAAEAGRELTVTIPWGMLSQVLGGALLLAAVGVLVVVLLL